MEHPDTVFKGTITADSYVEIGGAKATVQSVMVEWTNSAASGTFSIESTNKPRKLAADDSTSLQDWVPETGVTFEGAAPAGSAVGAQIAHIGNSGARRLRLKITHAADLDILVWVHGK